MLGYLKTGGLDGIPGGSDAGVWYAGCLLWLVTIFMVVLVWQLLIFCAPFCRDGERETSAFFGIVFSVTMVLPLIGQWLFWSRFIGLAGDRYVLALRGNDRGCLLI